MIALALKVGMRFACIESPADAGIVARLDHRVAGSADRWWVHWTHGRESEVKGAQIQDWIDSGSWTLIVDEPYEKPTLTRTTVETATGRELDVLAEALYGLKRYRYDASAIGKLQETDAELRARCAQTRRQLRAMPGADLLPDRVLLGIGGDPDPIPAGPYDDLFVKNTSPADLERKFGVGVDMGVPGSERIAINVVVDNNVIGQVIVDSQALGKNPTEALCSIVADVTRMMHGNLRASRGIRIKQTRLTKGEDDPRSAAPDAHPVVVCAGDTWETPEGDKLFVHSRIPNSAIDWNVAVNGSQITTSMFQIQITRLGKSKLLERTVCVDCGEKYVPAEQVAHICPATLTREHCAWIGDDSVRLMVRMRMEEVRFRGGHRRWCCTIGGIKDLRAQRCPIHDPAPKPAPWTPSWDDRYDG